MTRWYAVPDKPRGEYINILPSPGASEDEAIAFLPSGYDEEQQWNARLIERASELESVLRQLTDVADSGSNNWSDSMAEAWKNADVLLEEIANDDPEVQG